jgi:hypothetical protein
MTHPSPGIAERRYDSDMSNGHDKNWIRLCGAVDGFRVRYGRWPERVRIPIGVVENFRQLFSAGDMLAITAKVRFAEDDAPFVAEDDNGGSYSYGSEGFPNDTPGLSAAQWFGVSPKPEF